MRSIIVTAILLISSLAHAHGDFYSCKKKGFQIGRLGEAWLIEAVSAGFTERLPQGTVLPLTTRVTDIGFFDGENLRAFERRLGSKGFPKDDAMTLERINSNNGEFTIDDIMKMLREDWLISECPYLYD